MAQFNQKLRVVFFEAPNQESHRESLGFLKTYFSFLHDQFLLNAHVSGARDVATENMIMDFFSAGLEESTRRPNSAKGLLGFDIFEAVLGLSDKALFGQCLSSLIEGLQNCRSPKFLVILENFRKCSFQLKRHRECSVTLRSLQIIKRLCRMITQETDIEKLSTLLGFLGLLFKVAKVGPEQIEEKLTPLVPETLAQIQPVILLPRLFGSAPFEELYAQHISAASIFEKELLYAETTFVRLKGTVPRSCRFPAQASLRASQLLTNLLSLENEVILNQSTEGWVYAQFAHSLVSLMRLSVHALGPHESAVLEHVRFRADRLISVLQENNLMRQVQCGPDLFEESVQALKLALKAIARDDDLGAMSASLEQAIQINLKLVQLTHVNKGVFTRKLVELAEIFCGRFDFFLPVILQLLEMKGPKIVKVLTQGGLLGDLKSQLRSAFVQSSEPVDPRRVRLLGYVYNWGPDSFGEDMFEKSMLSNAGYLRGFTSLLKFVLLRANSKHLQIIADIFEALQNNQSQGRLKQFVLDVLDMAELARARGLKKIPTFYQKIGRFVSKLVQTAPNETRLVASIKLVEGMSAHRMSQARIQDQIKYMLSALTAGPCAEAQKGPIVALVTSSSAPIQIGFFKTLATIEKENPELLKKHKELLVEDFLKLLEEVTGGRIRGSQDMARVSVSGLTLSMQLVKTFVESEPQFTKKYRFRFLKILRSLRKSKKRMIRKMAGFIRLDWCTQ